MKRDVVDLVLYAGWWVLLLVGLIARDWWLFAPAAFMILLDHTGPRK